MNNDIAQWDMVDFYPEDWADEFIRILKPTGNLFIFTSYNMIGRWYNCLDHKFDTTNFMIWHKTNPAPKIFKAGFLNSCEMIFTCWNKKHTWNFSTQAEMHNFLESPICMRPERLSNPKHPSQKPIKILKKLIEIASNPGDIIFDPFMGVGSTGVAALELKRRFIGVEIDMRYCLAGRERIDNTLATLSTPIKAPADDSTASEPVTAYSSPLDDLEQFFRPIEPIRLCNVVSQTKLAPIIKWPGGKEKELKYINEALPTFNRYFEPFVGGGSVYMDMLSHQYYINDFSKELIDLYRNIASEDKEFYDYAYNIDLSWEKAYDFFLCNSKLIDIYYNFRNNNLSQNDLKAAIKEFCGSKKDEISAIISNFNDLPSILLNELEINLVRKMSRMKELEMKKHILPDKDVRDNIETAIKSAVYMNFRHLYNSHEIKSDSKLHSALFLFIRNYAYSGMFRYSSKGDFNVPYGGIAYNSKLLKKKLEYYKSASLIDRFKRTEIFSLDFEEFLELTKPSKDDFVFLDPPYDTEFSTYAQNDFTRKDQERLANYMINKCKAKWMLIIKNTDFIFNLYNRPGIKIRSFEKKYTVSFMNRNDKQVTHLLITNY